MLKESQSTFMQTLYSPEKMSQDTGFGIYQRSLIANAARALSITFSTVHSYVGNAEFTKLVRAYLYVYPKTQYDWGEYGDKFATFISTQPVSHAMILAEIAKLDFACHQAERSADIVNDIETLSLLSSEDPYHLHFQFNAGLTLLSSHLPIDIIKQLVSQRVTEDKITNVNDISNILHEVSNTYEQSNENKAPYYFVIWRPDMQANYEQITQGEFVWLSVLKNRKDKVQISIGEALDRITDETFSLVDWLPNAISNRLICGITLK